MTTKLAWPWSPQLGLWGGLDRKTKQRAIGSLQGALLPAAAVALPAAMMTHAGRSVDDDTKDTTANALLASGGMLAAHATHNMLMGDKKSPLAHSYQRGIGSDIRNIANQGRDLMGIDKLKMPRPPRAPKVASVESFKLAYGGDPYGRMPPGAEYYGQYGHDRGDDGGTGALNTALMVGGGAALAGGLHHAAMNARGNVLGGGAINAYQKGIGGSIRGGANELRKGLGVAPVAMPPHPLIGHMQDAAQGAKGLAGAAYDNRKEILGGVTGAAGAAVTAREMHNKMMADPTNLGELYRRVGTPMENLGKKVVEKGQQAAGWAAKKTAPKPPAAKPEPTPSVSPEAQQKMRNAEAQAEQTRTNREAAYGKAVDKDVGGKVPGKKWDAAEPAASPKVYRNPARTKKSSMIYQAGADDALATYLR